MSHIDSYLGPCPSFGWQGGPRFKTTIVDLKNGDEHRNADWIEARHEFSAPFKGMRIDAYREIKKMFLVCRAMVHAFRFRDALDFEATAEEFGVGDGATLDYQLCKFSAVDGVEYARHVYALAAAPVVTVDGVETAVLYNLRTGRVRFAAPPAVGAILRWSGPFDIWVRFATDSIPFSLDRPNGTNGLVQLIEVPAPDEEIVE